LFALLQLPCLANCFHPELTIHQLNSDILHIHGSPALLNILTLEKNMPTIAIKPFANWVYCV
jgi:hypothetical protein